ncbi:head GIN domain-containing protein [Hymenobacter sp. B81]|uniref:head GIN domain-containing protein n=1 Tax=Hymenobacter sp. B81 TaxID=3344878 RepID=UPI0037DD5289
MKTHLLLALLTAGSLSLVGCSKDGPNATIRGEGPSVTETRTTGSFSRVEVATDAEVTISQGPQQEVRVEAQRNILDVLETEASGGRLRIETGRYNLRSHTPIKVFVTVPSLTEARLSSNGRILSTAAWNASSFRVEDTGSGSIELALGQVQNLTTSITGSGSVSLSGAADAHTARLTGSGELQSYGLQTATTDLEATGSGRSYVRVATRLTAKLTGSGSAYYKGTPAVAAQTTGSGRVVDAN